MQKEKKTLNEASADLTAAVEELFEDLIDQFEKWLLTGKDFLPDQVQSLLTKLKEKGYKIVRED